MDVFGHNWRDAGQEAPGETDEKPSIDGALDGIPGCS
jgi:hypothetical protein